MFYLILSLTKSLVRLESKSSLAIVYIVFGRRSTYNYTQQVKVENVLISFIASLSKNRYKGWKVSFHIKGVVKGVML